MPGIKLTPDFFLIITWLWAIVGMMNYSKFSNNSLNVFSNRKYVYWFLIIMFISTFYPVFVYNQSIVSSLIAQRENYSIIFFCVFLYIHPLEKDFILALRFCAYACVGFMLISIVFPKYFITVEKLDHLKDRQSNGSFDMITAYPGINLLFFYFLFQLQKLFYNPKSKLIFEVIFLMLMILLLQNRSKLIIAIPLFFYAFYMMKSRKKTFYWVLGLLVVVVSSTYIFPLVIDLWRESLDQLNDKEYNRWQSISFFLFEAKLNFFTLLFGHGTPSFGSDYLRFVQDAQTNRLAYISDIGLLGAYYLYGISFVGIVYLFVLKALKKHQPYYLKFFACYIIFVPTIQNFGILSSDSAILYSMFFYLVIYNFKYSQALISRNFFT